jgi:LacI family transcriptional regulator
VAALAGVGVMTASRVLSGAERVGQDKTRRVLEAASTLGYRRNENARSLRPGQRTGLIGVVITNASNPYYAEMQSGIEEVLSKHEMRMLVGNTGEDVARERRLIADFIGWHVDGLIVVPAGDDPVQLSSVGIPVVLASRPMSTIRLDTVLIDDISGAREGTKLLLSEGHRRIAFVGHGMSVSTSQRRLKGFSNAFSSASISVDPELVHFGRPERDAALQAARGLLARNNPPTAIFSANNRNTIAILHAMSEQPGGGLTSIRVVSFDNFETADLMPIHLSLIDHDPQEMGRNAAALLMDRLRGGPRSKTRVIIELATRLLP